MLGEFVTAKRMGLSLEELNFFTREDFVLICELWASRGATRRGDRLATQADIDKFLG